MQISVLIVEDEPELQHRFCEAVRADSGMSLAAAVSNGSDAIAALRASEPDVLLLDLGLPDFNGLQVIRHAAQHNPQCDVLVVTMFGDDQHVMSALEAGATGYLLKDAGLDRIAASIRELHAGGSPISPGIARRVLSRLRVAAAAPANEGAEQAQLTQRETELLRLTAKGLSFDTIGQVLQISPHTVVAHVKKIYRKLAVHSRGEAVFEANRMGLL